MELEFAYPLERKDWQYNTVYNAANHQPVATIRRKRVYSSEPNYVAHRIDGSLIATHWSAQGIARRIKAKLIAAAPMLLQALETISLHAPSLDARGIRELADEAIAKAR